MTKTITTKKLFFMMLLMFACSICFCTTTSSAAYTKKSVQKEIKSLKKQIKSLSKKDKKQKKGLQNIGGQMLSADPCIIVTGLGIVTPSYYWVQNPKNFNRSFLGLGSGYVKKTNKYKKWNKYTCRVVVAKKINRTYEKKIETKKKKLKALQNTLKNQMTLSKNDLELLKGETRTLSVYWKYTDGYNKATWKSSNNSVISVTKSGKITAKRNGTATLTAKDTITGKKQSVKYSVVSPYIEFDEESYIFDRAENYSVPYLPSQDDKGFDAAIEINYCTCEGKYDVVISNEKVIPYAEEIDGVIFLKFGERGNSTITVSSEDGAKASCTIEITDSRILSFSESNYKLNINLSKRMNLRLSHGDWGPFKVDISNPAVLSLDDLGGNSLTVNLLALGTTQITLSDNMGIIAECTVEVADTYGDYYD